MTADYQVAETTPIGFAQVFSPGVFFRVGIGDTPAMVGVGASIVPEAREISATTVGDMSTTTENVRVVRYSAFVAIDVSLLPF